jgi:uncharacterized Fe-S cluster protein YjdI/CDGSH-type Zn-finger protein
MEPIRKEYTNGVVTIVFQPKKCFHSERCAKGLPEVFDPSKIPWINPNNASTERIIEQVRKCPSHALSYYLNEELTGDKITATIEVMDKGPYVIHGRVKIEDVKGKTLIQEGPFALCRCGQSKSKPFCDSTHRKVGFGEEDSGG